MKRAFDDGWGGVICKTLSLDASKARAAGTERRPVLASLLTPPTLTRS